MKLINHLKTINKHKYYVTTLCFKCGLYKQGLLHDLSKYSPTELKTGAKYWVGTRSPNSIERETIGYSSAWLHHKGRNKHHWEYWVDFSRDRVAATMVYRGENFDVSAPLDYYNKTHGYYVIHQETDAMIKDMLVHLSKSNLEETIDYIKETYL